MYRRLFPTSAISLYQLIMQSMKRIVLSNLLPFPSPKYVLPLVISLFGPKPHHAIHAVKSRQSRKTRSLGVRISLLHHQQRHHGSNASDKHLAGIALGSSTSEGDDACGRCDWRASTRTTSSSRCCESGAYANSSGAASRRRDETDGGCDRRNTCATEGWSSGRCDKCYLWDSHGLGDDSRGDGLRVGDCGDGSRSCRGRCGWCGSREWCCARATGGGRKSGPDGGCCCGANDSGLCLRVGCWWRWSEGDGGWDIGDDTRVDRDRSSADAGEVREGSLDVRR